MKKRDSEQPKADDSLEFHQEAALYLDFYASLLTNKQAEILNDYYNEDFSLSEIANGLGISKQAAHDALRSGTAALLAYEEKLGLVKARKLEIRELEETQTIRDDMRAAAMRMNEAAEELRAAVLRVSEAAQEYGISEISDELEGLNAAEDKLWRYLKDYPTGSRER